MANYTTLRKGNGNKEENEKLQQALQDKGYGSYLGSAGVDGIFGDGTEAAVKAYQTKMGLTVDGIAGDETWGSLMEDTNSDQSSTPTVAETAKNYTYVKEEDPDWVAANQKKEQVEASEPVLQGTYNEQYDQMYQEIMGLKPFEYDLNGDPLWQQYKDQYSAQGKLAQLDAQGQAAALSGGFGNSYAQRAGQQAYQGYMQQLNDKVPELYQLAMQKYNNDLALKKDQLATVAAMREDEYGRYMDEKNDYYTRLGLAREDEQIAHDRGSSEWYTGEQLRRDDENTEYTRQDNAFNKLASLISYGYEPTQEDLAAAGMTREQANALRAEYERGFVQDEPTYRMLDPDEVEEWSGKFYAARGNEAAIRGLMTQLLLAGVDPSEVAEYASRWGQYEGDFR